MNSKRTWWSLFFFIFLFLPACTPDEELPSTPTVITVGLADQPTPVELHLLASDPAAYEGAHLQLTGEYVRLPLLYCDSETHSSAATWTIGEGSAQLLAGGFDAQLRALLPDSLVIAVSGRWQRWQGDVGCGKRTTRQDIYYLEVFDIISPSPLVQITLTPDGAVADASLPQATLSAVSTQIADSFSPTPDPGATEPPPPPTPSLTPIGTLEPGATVQGTPSQTPAGLPSIPTMTAQAVGTPTAATGSTPTASASGSATPVTATPTGFATSSPTGTAPPDATATSPGASGTATHAATPLSVPTATAGAGNQAVISKGTFDAEELVTGQLDFDQIHAWDFTVSAGDAITVTVASSPGLDIAISIVDALGNSVWEQDLSPEGAIELLGNASLPAAGSYQIRLVAANGSPGTYAMMALFKDSYPFVAQGILSYGGTQQSSLAENNDHFWFFHGDTGELITISTTPLDSGDLFLELYGPGGNNLSGFVDDTIAGEPESLTDFTLPETGMYSIRVGEYDFLTSDYQILISGG